MSNILMPVKGNAKFVRVHATKANRGSTYMTPPILNLGVTWRKAVTSRPGLFNPRKEPNGQELGGPTRAGLDVLGYLNACTYVHVKHSEIIAFRLWNSHEVSQPGRNMSRTLVNKLINPLKTKRSLLYLKTQFVPRSKHFSSRL